MKYSDENIKIKDFKSLLLYQKSLELVDLIYDMVKKFPKQEEYAMSNQIIRAVTSISANIAEGNGQIFKKKEITFANNAIGSANEIRCWLELAYKRNYINKETFEHLDGKTVEIIKMTFGYMKKIKNEINNCGKEDEVI